MTKVDAIQLGDHSRAVLALHASGTGAASLVQMAEVMQSEVLVSIPNLHGYGKSSASELPSSEPLEQHVEIADSALTALLEQTDGRPVHLFGHSMGGLIALKLAAKHSAFASITLAEPMIFGVLDTTADADALAADAQSVAGLVAGETDGLAKFIEFWNGTEWKTLPDKAKTTLNALQEQITNEATRVSHDHSVTDFLGSIQCPVQVLSGTGTNFVAERICERLAQRHPTWKRVSISNAGHMLPLENPKAVADATLEAIRNTGDL